MEMDELDLFITLEDIAQMRKSLRGARYTQLFLLFMCFFMVLIGPGFRLRQGWRGWVTLDEEGTSILFECGKSSFDEDVYIKQDSVCHLHNHPDLLVNTLKGHYGSAYPSLWADLLLEGQYLALALIVLAFNITAVTLCISYGTLPCHCTLHNRKNTVMALLGICALCMLLVMSMEWNFLFCSIYPEHTMEVFRKQIAEERKKLESRPVNNFTRTLEKVEEEDILVRCYVIGYGAAACTALISMLIFLVDAAIFAKMCGLEQKIALLPQQNPAQLVKKPKAVSAKSTAPKPDVSADVTKQPEPITSPDISARNLLAPSPAPSQRSPRTESPSERKSLKMKKINNAIASAPYRI